MNTQLCNIVKQIFWNDGETVADLSLYEEMQKHEIAALAAPILDKIGLSEDLLQTWKKTVIRQVGLYMQYTYGQSSLPITVPYVVLKGTSAAQYYPYPEYRSMGDIDIMTGHEDYSIACEQLLDHGYNDMSEATNERHRVLCKGRLIVEVHASFAPVNDLEKARVLDDLIVSNITPEHRLPDFVNGLVLIGHINHHLEGGLGLRQIIDWMLFVNKCVPDDNWNEFKPLLEKTGLEALAIVITKMCVKYLGLPNRKWCEPADNHMCRQVMKYILKCGNFSRGMEYGSRTVSDFFTITHSPIDMLVFLQRRGKGNLKAAKGKAWLYPFAWIYQIVRYGRKAVSRKNAYKSLVKDMNDGKMRKKLIKALNAEKKYKRDRRG